MQFCYFVHLIKSFETCFDIDFIQIVAAGSQNELLDKLGRKHDTIVGEVSIQIRGN